MRLGKYISLCIIVLSFSCTKDRPVVNSLNASSLTECTVEEQDIILNSGIHLKKRDGHFIYLGDILVSPRDIERLDKGLPLFPESLDLDSEIKGIPLHPNTGLKYYQPIRALSVSPFPVRRFWTMLRYTYSPKITWYQRKKIRQAIYYIQSITNVRFFDATGLPTVDPTYGFQYPYVEFTPANFNASYVGRQGGKQELYIHDFKNLGTIVHEICHALGMFHEHARIDRDNYIDVHYANINPNKFAQFDKVRGNYFIFGEFDFKSIMLYDSYAFSKNNKPTITKKDGSVYFEHNTLSEKDRMLLNKFYLPYIAREDVCVELDEIVYDQFNRILSKSQQFELERNLNLGRCDYPLNYRTPQQLPPLDVLDTVIVDVFSR